MRILLSFCLTICFSLTRFRFLTLTMSDPRTVEEASWTWRTKIPNGSPIRGWYLSLAFVIVKEEPCQTRTVVTYLHHDFYLTKSLWKQPSLNLPMKTVAATMCLQKTNSIRELETILRHFDIDYISFLKSEYVIATEHWRITAMIFLVARLPEWNEYFWNCPIFSFV